MDLELKGKTVLVTGASKGIGLACAQAFAREGCALHLCARTADLLASAEQSIRSMAKVDVTLHSIDLSLPNASQKLVSQCPGVDILVNNAGAIPGGSIETVDETSWRAAWDLKVFGYINMTRAMLPYMYQRGHGVIINVIGMGGVTLRYDYACGAAGNAALIAFSKAVGSRAIDKGVRIVAVNPAGVSTDRVEEWCRTLARDRLGDANRWREIIGDVPFGRLIEPKEVADLVVYAASARASYLSGTAINLDGGIHYRR